MSASAAEVATCAITLTGPMISSGPVSGSLVNTSTGISEAGFAFVANCWAAARCS